MQIQSIQNDANLQEAFKRLEVIFQAVAGTPEFDEMEAMVTMIEAYESTHCPINAATPMDALKFRTEQSTVIC